MSLPESAVAANQPQAGQRPTLALTPTAPSITPKRPSWGVYTGWVMSDSGQRLKPGVYHHTSKTNRDGEGSPVDEWLASPVEVKARTLDTDTSSEGRLLVIHTPDGTREWVMPMEVLAGNGEDLRRPLLRMGAIIGQRQRTSFMEYLQQQPTTETVRTTSQTGWHTTGAFVLPDNVIGGSVRYQSSGSSQNLYRQAGTLAQWQAEVAALCTGNPVLTLAVGCALAGPLLKLVSVNGGGIHLVGDSSSGKSLAQLVAASVWGNPETFTASWCVTKNGLEIEAAQRTDTFLALDEIKRANPGHVQEMAYMLANGQGKGTMTREREGREKLRWRLLTLSSGERSLSEHAAISGNSAHAGAELRMVDVNAGTRPHRAFDDLHNMAGEVFHRTLSVAAGQHYGHLGPVFVQNLLADEGRASLVDDFAQLRNHFAVSNGQAGRVADRFAIIAMAGEMAVGYGLLPWSEGSCLADCLQLYGEWLALAGSGNAEDRQILSSVAAFIERHGSSRFSDYKDTGDSARIHNRAGYWEAEGQHRLYLFHTSGLQEAAPGFSIARIGKALDTAGAISKRDKDGQRLTKKYRLPTGGSKGLYVIDPERLDSEGAAHA